MKLDRRIVISALASMIFLSLALRYPETEHELGVDSFFIHNLATNIANDGFAEWILNPLSMFGWYPLSYPSGGPFLLAASSDLGGTSIETTILFLSLAFGAMGVLASFVMAREFRDDDLFCLSVAFIYSFAPRFLAFTLWSASMRGLFMVLLPIFVWSVLRTHREPKPVNFGIVLGLFLLLASTHRLAALLAVVMIAFIVAIVILVVLRIIRLSIPNIVLARPFQKASPYLISFAFLGLAGGILFGTDILEAYSVGELAEGSSTEIQLLNLGVSLARSVGVSLVFAVGGAFVLVRSRNKTIREPFLLLAFLGLTPTLFLRQYTGFYILPFIAIFAGLPILALSQLRRARLRKTALVASFVLMLTFSTAVLQYEVENSTALISPTYSTALYVSHETIDCRLISNDGLMGIRVAAISGCPVIPVGGAGTTFQSPELLAFHYFTASEVELRTVRVSLQDLTIESDSPWVASDIQAELDWVNIMQAPYNEGGVISQRYDPTLYVESKHLANAFFAYGNRYPSAFAVSAHLEAYKIYEGGTETVWYVGAPRF